ncbi:hypothetical protein [uncultured Phocaeicola sp.]|uniref:hypothetical protein n=1 Tax=uncultured Phocaeicola sp. TaxID=990718 RepID=UPI0025E9E586|nr:hypothetical protein [uncultured Phocaeicola sp.]
MLYKHHRFYQIPVLYNIYQGLSIAFRLNKSIGQSVLSGMLKVTKPEFFTENFKTTGHLHSLVWEFLSFHPGKINFPARVFVVFSG